MAPQHFAIVISTIFIAIINLPEKKKKKKKVFVKNSTNEN